MNKKYWIKVISFFPTIPCAEKILLCKSLIKQNVIFWNGESNIQRTPDFEELQKFRVAASEMSVVMQEATLSPDSEEVAFVLAGFVAKKLIKKNGCENCKDLLINTGSFEGRRERYFELLSRGGLTVPSRSLTEHVINTYAILDVADNLIQSYPTIPARTAAEEILQYNCNSPFACDQHNEWATKMCRSILVNIFFNNKQKRTNDSIRKNAVVGFKKRQRSKND